MTLKPLLPPQFDCLKPLLAEGLEESGLVGMSSPDYIIKKLTELYNIRSAGAYADSVESPKHCLIMTHFPSLLTDEVVATIHRIYTRKAFRGNPEDVDVLYSTAENYARLNGATTLVGSSWLFNGSKRTDALWTSKGYKLQSVNYVKIL